MSEIKDNQPKGLTTNELAMQRNQLAHERTLMAWLRTSLSSISFGFTIYKFFQAMVEEERTPLSGHLIGPRELGILMISFGLLGLLMATIQHRREMAKLRKELPALPYSIAGLMAHLFLGLGLLALIAVIFNQ
jgi:putative membrane protein